MVGRSRHGYRQPDHSKVENQEMPNEAFPGKRKLDKHPANGNDDSRFRPQHHDGAEGNRGEQGKRGSADQLHLGVSRHDRDENHQPEPVILDGAEVQRRSHQRTESHDPEQDHGDLGRARKSFKMSPITQNQTSSSPLSANWSRVLSPLDQPWELESSQKIPINS